MNEHKHDPDGIELDALTSDPEVRLRQLNLKLYSARVAAEKASAVYASAIKRMRTAEIKRAQALQRQKIISAR